MLSEFILIMLEPWTISAVIIGVLFLLFTGFLIGLKFNENKIIRKKSEEKKGIDGYFESIIKKISQLENINGIKNSGGAYKSEDPITTNLKSINDRLRNIINDEGKTTDTKINQNSEDLPQKNDDSPKETIGESQSQPKLKFNEIPFIPAEKQKIKLQNLPSQIMVFYNRGINNRTARDLFWEAFPKITRISNANAVAQRLGEASAPDFCEASNGEFLAIDGGNGFYYVVPLFDLTVTSAAFNEGGIGYVFECLNYDSQSARSILRINKPATFRCEGGKWTLAEGGKGELELQN